MADAEMLKINMLEVKRKLNSGDIIQDLKEGYVYFDITVDANGKKITFEKRVRLDKPERMLNKFVTKAKGIAEEMYKEQKYYVAQNKPPKIESSLDNENDVNDKMIVIFEEVGKYIKTKNPAVLGTTEVKF